MKIGIAVDRQDFFYDIHSLVKSFFPEDEVSVFVKDDPDRDSLDYDRIIPVHIPEYEKRIDGKNLLKRSLYESLSADTGKILPWGTLSGIRPTKIPMKLLHEGRTDDEIRNAMKEKYFVSEGRIDLSIEIAKRERKILEGIPEGWNLYAGIPFCPSICLYCTFSSSPIGAWKEKTRTYLEALIKELEAIREMQAGRKLNTIYIGGGTPTSLSPEELDLLLDRIDALFPTEQLLEYTVEAGRPDSITEDRLKVLRKHPVSRISVNPQTMNRKTLDIIGRRHTAEDTVRAFCMARKAGFENINMDIIMGLPEEGMPEVEHTLSEIEKLKPDSLTVHSLAVKRASRLRTEREEYENLTFRNSEEIMELTRQSAERMGLHPYYLYRQKNMKGNLENTGYAAEGKEGLYNMLIMEETADILAAGAGASTKFVHPDGRIERVVNPKDVRTYLTRIDELIEKKRNGEK
jgi:oxygen-independent coproporphyrinogen-3 oxidase